MEGNSYRRKKWYAGKKKVDSSFPSFKILSTQLTIDTSSAHVSIFLSVIMFCALNQFIEGHSDEAEDDDGGDYHVQLEYLRTINDQIAKASSGSQKFADDDAYQRQADVYFHAA